MSTQPATLAAIELDDARVLKRPPEVEHERRVALSDLLHSHVLRLRQSRITPPYRLFISVRESRLMLRFSAGEAQEEYSVALAPLRRHIKDYFLMCENYYEALAHAPADRLQTLDMARRSVHNEGSEELQRLLASRMEMDFATARRLFTLLCVLHLK